MRPSPRKIVLILMALAAAALAAVLGVIHLRSSSSEPPVQESPAPAEPGSPPFVKPVAPDFPQTVNGSYFVISEWAFIRPTVDKLPEEDMTRPQLQGRYEFPPYLPYGAMVEGREDPAAPGLVKLDDGRGYMDKAHLSAHPAMEAPASPRYQCAGETASARLTPEGSSFESLRLFQGEVIDAQGVFDFGGRRWVAALFNAEPDAYLPQPRRAFIAEDDLAPLVPGKVDESSLTEAEVPLSIQGLWTVDAGRRAKLAKDGFFIEEVRPARRVYTDDMADAYRAERHDQFFITSDLFLHAFHLIFDRMLKELEEKTLLPAARAMTAALAAEAWSEASRPDLPPALGEAAGFNVLTFNVAARLLDPAFAVPEGARGKVDALVEKIRNAQGTLGGEAAGDDFSQYRVRGHYEKSEELKDYFRGMMWLGRRAYRLKDDTETLAAALVPGLAARSGQEKAAEDFQRLLSYLVGRENNHTAADYRKVNAAVFGAEVPSAERVSPKALPKFREVVRKTLPRPSIVSSGAGEGLNQEGREEEAESFRFLGQRFTWDAYVFGQLTNPNLPRGLPSALDAMLLLGSPAAEEVQLAAARETGVAGYSLKVGALKAESADRLRNPGTFYDGWLGTLQGLLRPAESRQVFARSAAWPYKTLNTGLGSWTELKHDTILYTAQPYAAEGGEGEDFHIEPYHRPQPKGYVEPDPRFFARIAELSDEVAGKLGSLGFTNAEYEDKLEQLRDVSLKTGAVAGKQARGEPLTYQDYAWIKDCVNAFNAGMLWPHGALLTEEEARMALIADVATDATNKRVLEAAVGRPLRLVAAVKDAYGGTRLTAGFVYSWREFADDKRWSDKEWQAEVYGEAGPSRPAPGWYSKFQ